ncbi:MauE/DoxX family redox-associated membrane protein [Rhizohabitans arisaemae]|uniref:MauE/DoxX family redox-associated membrane protein n=1 Tax=Rhizohabitans arisaemae TaxID=2720610 RepID=UPI0024B15A02|nr:MauE/DoxX family redox-associated membrane protein [Rhizohabitans arisaemae]
MDHVVIGCRALLGIVFLVSASGKVRPAAFAEFLGSVRQLSGFRSGWVRPAGLAVVSCEGLIVISLAVPPLVVPGFVLAGLLLAAFTVAIAGVLRRGARTPCRCFGTSTTPLGARHVVRNLCLLTVAAVGVTGSWAAVSAPHPVGVAAALLAGGALALLAMSIDDIAELF